MCFSSPRTVEQYSLLKMGLDSHMNRYRVFGKQLSLWASVMWRSTDRNLARLVTPEAMFSPKATPRRSFGAPPMSPQTPCTPQKPLWMLRCEAACAATRYPTSFALLPAHGKGEDRLKGSIDTTNSRMHHRVEIKPTGLRQHQISDLMHTSAKSRLPCLLRLTGPATFCCGSCGV